MNSKMNQKGIIQIPLLIWVIVSLITVSAVGTGVVLYKQGKLVPLIASVSQIFKGTKNAEPEMKLEESQPNQEEQQPKPEKATILPLPDSVKESQNSKKEQASPQSSSPENKQQQCSSDTILCNAQCWTKCPVGQNFICRQTGATCCLPAFSCNNDCWNPCPTGYTLTCPSTGNPSCSLSQQCSSDTTFCNGQCWTKCPTGQTFTCPATGKAYCYLPPTIATSGAEQDLYLKFLLTISQYKKDQQSQLSDCYQRRMAELKEKNNKISAIGDQIDVLEAQASSICPKQFSEVCMVGSIRRQLEDINLQITILVNQQIRIQNQDLETVCSPSDISHSSNQPYIPLNYYSSSNLPSSYQIMPNSMGGYTVYTDDFKKSWTISVNNTGGFNIVDQSFNTWIGYPNGLGGYTVIKP